MVNINPEAMLNELNKSQKADSGKETKQVDMTKFLSVFCDKDKDEKKMYIRLLPITEDGGVFDTFKCHDMTVVPSPMFSNSKFKTFMCPSTENDEAGAPKKCPICEANKYYWDLYRASEKKKKEEEEKGEEADKDVIAKCKAEMEQYKECAGQFRQKQYYIIRCIERGKEEEGVKFWRFPANSKGDGIYDKIMTVWRNAYTKPIDKTKPLEDESNWKKENIFTLDDKGFDLVVNIKMTDDDSNNGKKKRVFTISRDDDPCALSNDPAKVEEWLNDKTSWKDLYAIKTYDYLNAVVKSGGKAPKWDKERGFYPDLAGTNSTSAPATTATAQPTAQPTATPTATATAQPTAPATAPATAGKEEDGDLPF